MANATTDKVKRKTGGFLAKMQELELTKSKVVADVLKGIFTLNLGDPSLDWATGGCVRGGCNLFWGPTKSGKSTLALKLAGIEQKLTQGWVIIFDTEYAHNRDNPNTIKRWIQCGLNPDMVLVVQSNRIDEVFGEVPQLEEDIRSGALKVSAIVVDSWGGLQTEQSIARMAEGDIAGSGNSFGGNAKPTTPTIQTFLRIAGENAITVAFVQHVYINQEGHGPKYIMPGGQKLRHLVHFELFIEPVEAKDARLVTGDRIAEKAEQDLDIVLVGNKVRAKCGKSRNVVSGRRVEYWMNFENCTFANPADSLFDLAKKLGVLQNPSKPELDNKGNVLLNEDGTPKLKVNSTYWEYPAVQTSWHGRPKTVEALAANKDLFDAVFAECMGSKKVDAAADIDLESIEKTAEPKKRGRPAKEAN